MPLNGTGPRILYIRTGHYPTDKFSFADVMCVANALQELCMRDDDYCVVCGIVQILDMSEYSAAHMLQMTPTVVKKMSIFAEDANTFASKSNSYHQYAIKCSPMEATYHFIRTHSSKIFTQECGGENGSIEELTQGDKGNF
ncbi:hypothetical protein CVS40_5535 [Lucilia cuprina]|nr:hypothetical protein CVS40_5535 [Lucilia cuprina]